jgi:uncharacterized membrane protein
LVYSIYDSTEVAVQKMIEASQRMLRINSQGGEGGLSSIVGGGSGGGVGTHSQYVPKPSLIGYR